MKVLARKWMKAFCCLLPILFSVVILSGNRFAYGDGDLQTMTQFANIHLLEILDGIPVGEEQKYGFLNRDEFMKASLGIPYQEYDMDKEEPTGYWRIPVTVEGGNRALIRLEKASDGWGFSGFGGAGLAQEVGDQEHDMIRNGYSPRTGRIIRDFSMRCDYVQYNKEPDSSLSGTLYPLMSASQAILMYGIGDGAGDGGYDLVTIKQMRLKAQKMVENPDSF